MNLLPKHGYLRILLGHLVLQLLETIRSHHHGPALHLLQPHHQQGYVLTELSCGSHLFTQLIGQQVGHPAKVVHTQIHPHAKRLLLLLTGLRVFPQCVDDLMLVIEVCRHVPEVQAHFQHSCLQITANSGHLLPCGIPLCLEVVKVVDNPSNRRPNRLQHLIIPTLPGVCLRNKISALYKPRIYKAGITSTSPRMILCWRCDPHTVTNRMDWMLDACHECNSEEFRTCHKGRMKKSSLAGRLTT